MTPRALSIFTAMLLCVAPGRAEDKKASAKIEAEEPAVEVAAPAPKIGDALTFTTAKGHELKGAVLRRIEPDGMTLETPAGFEKLPYTELPADIARHFKFSEEEVARYIAAKIVERQIAAAKQAAEAAAAETAARENARQQQVSVKPAPVREDIRPAPLGARGAKSLGSPRLGAKGGEK